MRKWIKIVWLTLMLSICAVGISVAQDKTSEDQKDAKAKELAAKYSPYNTQFNKLPACDYNVKITTECVCGGVSCSVGSICAGGAGRYYCNSKPEIYNEVAKKLPTCVANQTATQECSCDGQTVKAGQVCTQGGGYTYVTEGTDPTGCEHGSPNRCVPYCFYEKTEECFLCPIFAVVFNTVSKIQAKAINEYSSSVVSVVVVAFGIWLALQILAFASSMETGDLKKFTQDIITKAFVVMLVVAILSTGVSKFFDTFVTPVYLTGQGAAQVMFESDNTSVKTGEYALIQSIDNGLNRSIGDSIVQTMTTMENAIRKFKALGSGIICYSFTRDAGAIFIFPNMTYFLTGIILWVLTVAMMVILPFLMIDSVFQLGVVGALLPPAIGAYAFKPTRAYTKKIWETFLNSMFAFVFVCITVLIILGVLQEALTWSMNSIGASQASAASGDTILSEDGETGAQEGASAVNETMPVPRTAVEKLAEQHYQVFKKHEGRVANVYFDSKGFPTIGVGHLLFRQDTSTFEAWYHDKIQNFNFINLETKKPITNKKELFQKLYNSCRAGHCNRSLVAKVGMTEAEITRTYWYDFGKAYSKTVGNSNCNSSNPEVIWKTFNRGNAKHCNGKMAYRKVATSGSGGSTSDTAKVLSSDYNAGAGEDMSVSFDMLFQPGAEAATYFAALVSTFHWASLHFIRLAFVFLLAWSVLKTVKDFAKEMADSISNTEIGSSIGTVAASTAAGMAKKAGTPMLSAAERGVRGGLSWAGRKTVGLARSGIKMGYMKYAERKMAKSGGTWKSWDGYTHTQQDGIEKKAKEKLLKSTVGVASGSKTTTQLTRKTTILRNKELTLRRVEIIKTETKVDLRTGNSVKTEEVVGVKEELKSTGNALNDMVARNGKFDQKAYDKMLRGVSGDSKKAFEKAIAEHMAKERFSRALHDKYIRSSEVVNSITDADGNKEITIKQVTRKGEVIYNTVRYTTKGYVETTQSIIKANGEVLQLSSDGMRNKRIKSRLVAGTDFNNLTSAKDVDASFEKDDKGRVKGDVGYSYAKYYQNKIDHGADPRTIGFDEEGNQLGMMSWEEAIGYEDADGRKYKGAFRVFVDRPDEEFNKYYTSRDITV